jgi:N-acetylneuraminate synthase
MNNLKPSHEILIDKRKISNNDPVYFIAEIGSNFDGDLDRAKELIYMAKDAGADAAKFQHYTANSLVSDNGFKALSGDQSHQSSWNKSVYETYESASLNSEWTSALKKTCEDAGLSFLTSPYSFELVDLVDPYVPAYKIGSGDITWLEIIQYMASKGKPIILATGASSFTDVCRAVDEILSITSDIILLQCNTNYTASPSNFSHLQLGVISEFQKQYPGIITGLSDHMQGHVSVLGAVALGARVIEKHFTDSNDRPGPDHAFAMTPATWREMVDRTRELEDAMGDGQKKIEDNELETVVLQRRSIYSVNKIKKNSIIKKEDIAILRPCPKNSIEPFEIDSVVNRTASKDIPAMTNIKWSDLK